MVLGLEPIPFGGGQSRAQGRGGEEGGGYELMDPTDERARELLPYYDDDRSYLVCRPEGEILMSSPVRPPEENMMRVRTTGSLSAAGTLTPENMLDMSSASRAAWTKAFQ